MAAENSYQSQIKELSSIERELSIVIPSKALHSELDKAYQRLSQRVNLKGFRKGKAPRHILEQYYRPDVEKEVLNKVLSQSYQTALQTHILEPVSEPSIEALGSFDVNQDFAYKATVEIKPQIQLRKWKGLHIEVPVYAVNDDLVLKELKNLQERHSTLSPITDRSSVLQGDIAECQVSATAEGQSLNALSGKGKMIEVGSDKFFHEVEQALIGKEIGQTIEVDATLPEGFQDESLKGKTAHFSVIIDGIKTKQKPALDDEFAKDVSDKFENLGSLKTAILASLTESKARQEESEKRNAVILALIENNPFEVPKSLVEKQAEYAASRVLSQMPQKQAEQIWKTIGTQLKEEVMPNALKTVQASLLCEAITKEQNIHISKENVESQLDIEANQMKVTKQQLKSYYKADGIEHLKFRLTIEKALDLVLENAEIKTVEKIFGA